MTLSLLIPVRFGALCSVDYKSLEFSCRRFTQECGLRVISSFLPLDTFTRHYKAIGEPSSLRIPRVSLAAQFIVPNVQGQQNTTRRLHCLHCRVHSHQPTTRPSYGSVQPRPCLRHLAICLSNMVCFIEGL